MLESGEYSRGGHAVVRWATPEERTQFPGADLVREQYSRGFFVARFMYERHLAAKALFPAHFIDMVGFYDREIDNHWDPSVKCQTQLFSKLAQIPPEHAAYSAHMTKTRYYHGIWSDHQCDDCIVHREFHAENNLVEAAKDLAEIFAKQGITVDKRDPSDYCLERSTVIFFEVDGLERK